MPFWLKNQNQTKPPPNLPVCLCGTKHRGLTIQNETSNTNTVRSLFEIQTYTCFACVFMYLLENIQPSYSLVPI